MAVAAIEAPRLKLHSSKREAQGNIKARKSTVVDHGALWHGRDIMKSKQKRYAPEFRRIIVEPVRTGRKPRELTRNLACAPSRLRCGSSRKPRDAGGRR